MAIDRLVRYVRNKQLDKWMGGYLRQRVRLARQPEARGTRHLLLAVCDHYEPLFSAEQSWTSVPHERGLARVAAWEDRYPVMARCYSDADGLHPKHTFFFPGEQYHPDYVEPLARLGGQGFSEVELHLHHHDDTEESLRRTIPAYLEKFAQHGHLTRSADGGLRYAFIHGDWALANARADGANCGVDAELPLLFDTGCYADFTFPAAPDECQPNICNQIYWPTGDLARRRAYEHGQPARVGEVKRDRLLIIQGPLTLTLRSRRVPVQLENSDLTDVFPADQRRVRAWVDQRIHVEGRPEWLFVKLHTHGAPEQPASSLLGWGGHALHQELRDHYNDGERWQLHYVTAREMYNIAIAAMDGKRGNPGDFRDYVLPPPPVAAGG